MPARVADVLGQRQAKASPALAAHPHRAGNPVEVIETQTADIAGAQAEPCREQQSRPVAQVERVGKVACDD